MKTWIPDSRNFAYLNWKQVEAPAERCDFAGAADSRYRAARPSSATGHRYPDQQPSAGKALEKLPADLPVYALPPVCYGKSNEHIGFPGTLSVSATTFMAVVRDLGASLAASGFKKLVLYNTHGGNSSLVDVMARDLRAEFGLRTFALYGSGGISFEGVSEQERTYGFHAGEIETAFLLSAVPELVDTTAYTVNYIAEIDKPELLRPENAPATFAWLTRDIAVSGVMGDPRPATAENGAHWVEQAATRIADALQAMARYENLHRP